MKFRIGLVQEVVEEATIYIEADNAEEAERKAIALCAEEGNGIPWDFLMTKPDEDVRVVSVDAA